MEHASNARDLCFIPCEAGVPVKNVSDYSVNHRALFHTSVVRLVDQCAKRQRNGNYKIIQIVVGLLGSKWIEWTVLLQLLILIKKVELLHYYYKLLRLLAIPVAVR